MQKFFDMLLPMITEGVKDSSGKPNQSHCVHALSDLQMGRSNPSISQLLQQWSRTSRLPCMQLPDAELRANVAEVFATIAANDALASTALTEHATTLVKALLATSVPTSGETSSIRLRIASLHALAAIPAAVRYDILHPMKPIVLTQLGKAVDDRKRSVRKEAVEARAKWYQYHG
jgi:DNA repair/transcription protein MET18/MMS19